MIRTITKHIFSKDGKQVIFGDHQLPQDARVGVVKAFMDAGYGYAQTEDVFDTSKAPTGVSL